MITHIKDVSSDDLMKISMIFATMAYAAEGERFRFSLHPSAVIYSLTQGAGRKAGLRMTPAVAFEVVHHMLQLGVLTLELTYSNRPDEAPLYFRCGDLGKLLVESVNDAHEIRQIRAELSAKFEKQFPKATLHAPDDMAAAEREMTSILSRISRP